MTIGMAENSPSGKAYHPGDIIKSLNGMTVEVGNTDAEGRLTLADSMVYAQRNHHSTVLLEMSTLTGSVVHTLGKDHAGLYSNSTGLAEALLNASRQVNENLVYMQTFPENYTNISNTMADVTNSSTVRH